MESGPVIRPTDQNGSRAWFPQRLNQLGRSVNVIEFNNQKITFISNVRTETNHINKIIECGEHRVEHEILLDTK